MFSKATLIKFVRLARYRYASENDVICCGAAREDHRNLGVIQTSVMLERTQPPPLQMFLQQMVMDPGQLVSNPAPLSDLVGAGLGLTQNSWPGSVAVTTVHV